MKVLWVCTSPVGPMAKALDRSYQGSSGGWITAEYERIKNSGFKIAFLTVNGSVKRGEILRKEYEGSYMFYIGSPKPGFGIKPPEWMRRNIKTVYDEFCPDLIQIWGTESVLSCAAATCSTEKKKLIFLQGIIGIYVRYKKVCLYDEKQISFKYKLTEKLKNSLYQKQADFERKALEHADGVILDNDFSEAYCTSANPELKIIRYPLLPQKPYYRNHWDHSECEPHSVFTVAGSSPMKGLHQLLRIVSRLKDRFKDVKLYVPGSFSNALREMKGGASDYEKLLYKIIQENQLENRVVFTGKLTPEEMADYMRRCALFVNPSFSEVHALSLREAMTIGMPCISTVCGSVSEFIRHGENGLLYRFAEPEVCESYIARLLGDQDACRRLSEGARSTWESSDTGSLAEIYRSL